MKSETICNFSQIELDFLKVYNSVTKEAFNNKIIILDSSKIYKHTHGSSAAMRRRIWFGKNKIWIRQMPIHQIFYELAHEIGHTINPHLENRSLDAEETKAILFQYVFSHKLKSFEFDWIEDFIAFEDYRIDHIRRTEPKYYQAHCAAKDIAKKTNYDFQAGISYIVQILDSIQ